jgi:3-oxoadipate enol-lactonase
MSKIDLGDVVLNYRIDGPPGAPWVMLAHGLATNLHLWDHLAGVLAQSYRVLRYDARGHGQSSVPPGDYSLDLLVSDARRLLDALSIERTHVVGLSMGGMVSLGLAIEHSERIAGAAVCDARVQATQEYRDGWDHRIGLVRMGGLEAVVEHTLKRWFTPAFHAAHPERLDEIRRMVCATPPAGHLGCAAALKNLNYAARLGTIAVPMLYLTGAQDLGAPPEVVKAAQAATPGARYVEIPGAGHISNIEQPELFARAIVDFLGATA